jgi:hypothetical protein
LNDIQDICENQFSINIYSSNPNISITTNDHSNVNINSYRSISVNDKLPEIKLKSINRPESSIITP